MTIQFEFVPSGQRRRWDDALRDVPHGYWHAWPACHAVAIDSGNPTWLCVASDARGVVAAVPVAEREWGGERDLFTPVGFSGFAISRQLPHDFNAQWSAFAAAKGYVAGYFALHPEFGVPAAHSRLSCDNELFVLDLSGGPDAVLQRCDRSVRRAVKASVDAGLQIVDCRKRLTAFVLDNYASCLATLGARVDWGPATLAAMCADPELLMAGIEDDAGICAVHTFGVAGRGAEFHLHLWVREGRSLTTGLIWWGIRRLASGGIAWVNLGGGMTRGDSLAQAKRKYRPWTRPFLRAREIYRPGVFRELCDRAGVEPGEGRFHPAYHAAQMHAARAAEPSPQASR